MVDLVKEKYDFHDLLKIMEILRGKNGCPWDMEQTHQSIRRDFLEEAYEVAEAIDRADDRLLCEELGDVLMNVVFHASIAREQGSFDIGDVCDGICKKMIHRHPHVFGGAQADTSAQVLENWDQIKRAEKSLATHTDAIRQVAKSLPALMYAEKLQKKARKAGFDWPDISGAMEKVREETAELEAAAASGGDTEDELGDLLFAAVNTARFLKVDPEQALFRASRKFAARFAAMEAMADRPLESMTLEQMDKLWNTVKLGEKTTGK